MHSRKCSSIFTQAPEQLNCLYSNVDSLLNKKDELEARISQSKPDVIALTEIFPKNIQYEVDNAELSITGYKLFLSTKRKRGVAIYIKENLEAYESNMNGQDFEESVWIDLITAAGKILIGCIYRSPSSATENDDLLKQLLRKAMDSQHIYVNVVIVGDFNIPEIDWNTNAILGNSGLAHAFIDLLDDLYLNQLITKPTRVREGQQSNVLDLLITDQENIVEHWELNAPLGKSDHLTLDFTLGQHPLKTGSNLRYAYYKGRYDEMRKYVTENNSFDVPTGSDTITRCSHLEAAIMKVTDLFVPKFKSRPQKPLWMNKETREAVKSKHKAWNIYQKHRSEEARINYNTIRNKTTKIVKQAKQDFEHKLSNEVKSNPKSFWKYVQSKTKSKSTLGILNKPDGSQAETDQDKAETLNQFFASVFTVEDMSNVPSFQDRAFLTILDNITFTQDMVRECLSKLDHSKSPGPDGVHNRVLKELADILAQPVADLFNESMDSGVVPASWRTANVTPIFKKGDKRNPGNYRPVSLTSTLGKLMEKIVRDEVNKHMTSNKLYSPHQHGFKKGKSCGTQLLEVSEDWTSLLDDDNSIDCIYLDYKKAFDSVPHQRLMTKVYAYGIRGKLWNWIKAYLHDRSQQVVINGFSSKPSKVSSGIPQGSVLGPELFLIFINDLPEIVKSPNGVVKLFADDTKLYSVVNDKRDQVSLQEDLQKINEWADLWQLPFNQDKCKVVHYGRKNPGYTYQLSDDGSIISSSSTEKDLGVTFDNQLKFTPHVDRVAATSNRKMGIIKRTFSSLDPRSLVQLYKAIVRPSLEYCSQVWHPCLKKDQQKLEKVQRRATKCLTGLKDCCYSDRLASLKLPSLSYRRHRADLIQTFKIVKGLEDINPDTFFKFSSHGKTRGHRYKITKQRAKTNRRLSSFSQRMITEWNNLPDYVVNSSSLNSFKANLEKAWRNRDKYDPDQPFLCPCSH